MLLVTTSWCTACLAELTLKELPEKPEHPRTPGAPRSGDARPAHRGHRGSTRISTSSFGGQRQRPELERPCHHRRNQLLQRCKASRCGRQRRNRDPTPSRRTLATTSSSRPWEQRSKHLSENPRHASEPTPRFQDFCACKACDAG